MSQNLSPEGQIHPPLECSALVYRLARRRSDLDPDTNELSPAVFIRKQGYDDLGLSVIIADAAPLDDVKTSERYAKRCYGIGTLHVGIMRNQGLDTVPDDIDHANVTGVPYPDDDFAQTERLSNWLAGHARTIWTR